MRLPVTAAFLALLPLTKDAAGGAEVIVYGGTPCGLAAAITAQREGAPTLLLEPTRHVGGLSTSGINTAETEHMLKWTIGGFADEFYRRMGARYGTGKPEYYFESSVAEQTYLEMLKEAGVEVRYGVAVERVEKEGTNLRKMVLTDGTTVTAKVFIDASYEGDLMARAGVSYRVGREAKDEFHEEAAGVRLDATPRHARTVDETGALLPGISGWAKDYVPGSANPLPMNYNFRLTVAKDPQYTVPIPTPAHYDAKRYALLADWLREKVGRGEKPRLRDVVDLYGRRNGKFELNNTQAAIISLGDFGAQGGWADGSYAQRQAIFQEHLDYTLGLLHFIATDPAVPAEMQAEMKALGLHRDEFADNGHLPYQLYVREARRMRSDFVMTQRDVQEDRRKADSIGLSSHFIDCHHVQRLAVNDHEFVNEGRIWRVGYANQIPYRALVPKAGEAANLLVPCAASYSHVAFCTLRLESVWMITGHAAGLAAAMATLGGESVQAVPVEELQARLRAEGQVVDFLPGQPEKDPQPPGWAEF